jgi:hypothetical protein
MRRLLIVTIVVLQRWLFAARAPARFRWRARRTEAIAALLLVCWSIGAFAGSPARTGREKSSQDDCRVIIAVGKHQLGWSPAAAPPYDFYPHFGDYVEDCAWQELGVAEPRTGNHASLSGFYITRPAYDGASATAEIHTFRRDQATKNGVPVKPEFTDNECTLERDGSGWSIKQCFLIKRVIAEPPKVKTLINPVF